MTKIAPKAVESWLAKPDSLHRAVLFYGPDSGLARQRAKQMAKTFLGASYDPFALMEINEAKLVGDPALLADELSSIGLLVSQRVILIGDGGDKLTKIVEAALPFFNHTVFLIVCADELSPRSSLRAWFEKEPSAAAIACYHDEIRDVQSVVRKDLEAAGIAVTGEVIDYLAQQLGNDRGVTRQEIAKLITYAGDSKQLQLDDVRQLVDYNRETGFDDMVNAVADRNVQSLEKNLTLLLRDGNAPVAYLRALQRYFNRLYALKSQMENGQSAEQVIQSIRPPVFFRQVPILTRHLQQWNTDQVAKALRLLIAAELACKTSDLPMVPASTRRLLQVTQVR